MKKTKKKSKIKDKIKKKSKEAESDSKKEKTRAKIVMPIINREKTKVTKIPTMKAKNPKIANPASINNYESDYDYSNEYSDKGNYDDYYSGNENDSESKSNQEEYSSDEKMSINENEAKEFVAALNSASKFERRIIFHNMPESVHLIPTIRSMQDGLSEEMGGSQFDILGNEINKYNEEKCLKINTSPLKNIILPSEGKDINTAFNINIVSNEAGKVTSKNGFDLNDDKDFDDDISMLPVSMQISLKGIRSCFNELNNVLVDISDITNGFFKSIGYENDRLEEDFRLIETDRSSLVNEKQFKLFKSKSDFVSQVSDIIKL